MKLPGKLGQAQNLANPTRRNFLKMGAAAVLQPPVDIKKIGGILEQGITGGWKLPFPEEVVIEGLTPGVYSDYDKLRDFILKFKPNFSDSDSVNQTFGRQINYSDALNEIFGSAIRQHQEDFMNNFGKALEERLGDSRLLRLIKSGKAISYSSIDTDFGDDDYGLIERGVLKTPEDILPHIGGEIRIDLKNLDEGNIEEMRLWFDISKEGKINFEAEMRIKDDDFDQYVLESGYEEYDETTRISLDDFQRWFEKDFKGLAKELYRRYPGCKEYIEKKKQKTLEDKQLPAIKTEFQELMNQILSGKIEITDEVRERVKALLV